MADLLELLKVYEDRTRYRAKRELAQRKPADVLPALEKWIAGLDKDDSNFEHQLLEALWMYQTFNVVESELLHQLLNAKDHRARAAAVRVASFWIDRLEHPISLFKKRIDDEHPRVRLEAVRALSFMKGDDAMETALGVLEHEMDYYLEYTLDETMRQLENQ